jgi:hypothetical protein
LVEHQLPKLRVAGSIPVVRFSETNSGTGCAGGSGYGDGFTPCVRVCYNSDMTPGRQEGELSPTPTTNWLIVISVCGAVIGIVAPVIGIASVSSSENGLNGLGDALAPLVAGFFIGFLATLAGSISGIAALIWAGRRGEPLRYLPMAGILLSLVVLSIYFLVVYEIFA